MVDISLSIGPVFKNRIEILIRIRFFCHQISTPFTEITELFYLDILGGNWESINLNATLMIHRNDKSHQLSIVNMNETTKQANPSTYEIQEDEQGYFVYLNDKRTSISYCQKLDMFNIATMGDYMRN